MVLATNANSHGSASRNKKLVVFLLLAWAASSQTGGTAGKKRNWETEAQ